ncbi:MAG: penicillin-binding protein [Fibrobacteres bacterium]|nr:penicillin-binding protein [Fibrobacterota bacterium]
MRRPRLRLGILAALFILAVLFHRSLPDPLFRTPFSTVALARDGRLLGAKIADDGQWRFPAAPCPARFAVAAMAYEDRRFRRHPGVDPIAVIRAAVKNIRARKVVSGASTLTMQVIRLSRPGRSRSLAEKIAEAFLSLRLEMSLGKDGILALYASHAPFGGNVVGLTAASWRYFGRGPESLSWGEAALLAVLPNSPSLMHPGRNRDLLVRKRDRLLVRLWRDGKLDSLECALARLEPLPDKPIVLPRLAPHLVERLATGSGPGTLWRTTVDADLQARADEVLARRRRELEGAGIQNGAVLVLDTRTGAALAYVGNMPGTGAQAGAETAGGEVDIISSPRSTGSLLKPFLYASMLEAGEILPGTLVPDIPSLIGGYAPENFDRGYEGAVPARMALARSLNVPAVRMLKDFGIDRFLHGLRALGMTTADRSAGDYGLTLVLGGAEGNLWELTGMYAGLAREAQRYAEPSPDAETRRTFFPPHLLSDTPGKVQAIDPHAFPIGPAAAWFALQAMAEVSRPDAEKSWRSFSSSRWVAWKTGTSFGFRDAWAVGVTPEYTVGVWIGNASGQGRPGMTGIQVAAPVLFETFNLLPSTTGFEKPMASLLRIPVCRQSGMRPSPFCPAVDSAWVPAAGLRTAACPYHRLVHLDPKGAYQVHDGCQNVAQMRHAAWFVLPPSQEWYYRQRHSDYLSLPPWRKDCEEGSLALGRPRSMDLIYPRGTAKIYVPIDLDARRGRTVFEAVHRDPAATVFWHLDKEYLGMTREFHKMEIDPAPGRHTLLLVDNRGERLEHVFEVLARDDAAGK